MLCKDVFRNQKGLIVVQFYNDSTLVVLNIFLNNVKLLMPFWLSSDDINNLNLQIYFTEILLQPYKFMYALCDPS